VADKTFKGTISPVLVKATPNLTRLNSNFRDHGFRLLVSSRKSSSAFRLSVILKARWTKALFTIPLGMRFLDGLDDVKVPMLEKGHKLPFDLLTADGAGVESSHGWFGRQRPPKK